MPDRNYTIFRGNVTVLGCFNPAILRPDFIKQEFPNWNLGQGELVTPDPVPLIADIRYEEIRLFMDPDQMVFEDTQLSAIEEMNSPGFTRDYLDKLRYTPLKMVGLNLLAETKTTVLAGIWSNIADTPRMPKIIEKSGRRILNMTVSYHFPKAGPTLHEVIFETTGSEESRMRFTLGLSPDGQNTRMSFNAEFRDVATNRARIDFLAENFSEIGNEFFAMIDLIGKENQ